MGSGGSGPSLIRKVFFFSLLTCLTLKFLHRQDSISLFNWLIFLKNLFAIKLNFRYIQKWGVPSRGLLASARKAVLPDRRSPKHVLFSAFFQPVPSAENQNMQLWTAVSSWLALVSTV